MKIKEFLENTFAAVTFAEENVEATELGVTKTSHKKISIGETLRDVFAAVAFAEENCHDIALDLLTKKHEKPTLTRFLEDVGLAHVPVRLCVVNL